VTSVRALASRPLPRSLSVAFCGLVVAGIVLVARSAALLAPVTPHPAWVTTAATFDLTVTASLVTWWMLRRDFGWSGRALLAIFLAAVTVAGLFLPDGRVGPLRVMHVAAAPLELLLLAYLARRVASARRRAMAMGVGRTPDAHDTIAAATADVVGPGRFAEILAYEISVLYHALSPRRARTRTTDAAAERADAPSDTAATLTYHRKAAYGAVVFVLLLVTLAEIPAMHLLLRHWSERAAWIWTALGLYGALWIVGDWRACRIRPVRVEDGTLRFRFGLRWRMDIPLASIRAVRAATPAERATKGSVDLRLALPGSSWTVLELDRPIEATGMYGIRRTVRTLGLGLDDPARLEALLEAPVPSRSP
jgi:hypothetical protein